MALYLPEDLVPKMFAPLSHLELLILPHMKKQKQNMD